MANGRRHYAQAEALGLPLQPFQLPLLPPKPQPFPTPLTAPTGGVFPAGGLGHAIQRRVGAHPEGHRLSFGEDGLRGPAPLGLGLHQQHGRLRLETGLKAPQEWLNSVIRPAGNSTGQGAVHVVGVTHVTAYIAVTKVECEAVEQQSHGVGSRVGVAQNSVRDWLAAVAVATSIESKRTWCISKRRMAKGARG